jgi:predicted transcriptional regulator
MSGYIKLYRSARGTAIAQHPEYFAAWVHLLLMATHKAHDQVVGTKVVKLQPGQLVFGRQKFSANTGISENKVRSALGVMKELGMITSKSHAKFSVITITKWSEYQGETPADNQQSTSNPPASNHKQECIKKGKNEQEELLKSGGQQADSEPAVELLPTNKYNTEGEEYPVTQSQIDEWQAIYPAVNCAQEVKKAKAWIKANQSRAKTYRGMAKFLNGWMSRQQDKGGTVQQPPSGVRARKDFPFGS